VKGYKIGRNDPCPCGSGKKYKNCCLGLDEIAGKGLDTFERYNQLLTALKVKLDDHFSSDIRKVRREARQQFMRFADSNEMPSEHESLFSDWLWFDFSGNGAVSKAQQYYAENGSFMDPYLSECLQGLIHSSLAIFTPVEASDTHLVLQNLINGSTCRVMLREPWDIAENCANILLLGRIVDTNQGSLFSGMVLMQKNDAGQKQFILDNVNYLKSICNLSDRDFCKQYGEVLYGLFCHAMSKTKLSLNDIRAFSFSNLEYPMPGNDLLVPLYKAGGWEWFQPVNCAGYARVAVKDDMVLVCTDLAEDLPLTSAWLARFEKIAIKYVCNLLQAPAISDAPLWFAVMKDQETEKWLHTPHQELEGQTPLQVLGKGDRQRLLDLLDSFTAEKERSEEEKELVLFMRERIEGFKPE
jgi:hypothetical protein